MIKTQFLSWTTAIALLFVFAYTQAAYAQTTTSATSTPPPYNASSTAPIAPPPYTNNSSAESSYGSSTPPRRQQSYAGTSTYSGFHQSTSTNQYLPQGQNRDQYDQHNGQSNSWDNGNSNGQDWHGSDHPLSSESFTGSSTQSTSGSDQSDRHHELQQKEQDRQQHMMALEGKRMAKEMGREITRIHRLQKKLVAQGMTLPQGCLDAVASLQTTIDQIKSASSTEAMDELMSNIQDLQQTLGECESEGQQLIYAPKVMKMMKQMISRLNKKGIDVSQIKDEYDNQLVSLFADIKSGSATDDQVQNFFDTADDLRSQMEDVMNQSGIDLPSLFKTFDDGQGQRQQLFQPQESGVGASSTATTTSSRQSYNGRLINLRSQVASLYEAIAQLKAKHH